MPQSTHDSSVEVMALLDEDAAGLVFDLARERLSSQLPSSVNLIQRVVQLAALEMTAAALAANVAGAVHGRRLALVAALATVTFVAAAILALVGARSNVVYSPGVAPSRWTDALDHPAFDLQAVRTWALSDFRTAIAVNAAADRRRAKWLNLSIVSGVVGSGLLAIVALCAAAGTR